MQITANNPIDRLGGIRKQMDELKVEEAKLSKEVKDLGIGSHEGEEFRAVVSQVSGRKSLDAKMMEMKLRELGVDDLWFTVMATKTTEGYSAVKLSSIG